MDDIRKNAPKLLVVDDEAAIRDVMALALQAGGYECVTSADGHEALEIMQAAGREFECVITDLHMPQMDGIELIRHLRKFHVDLPVVVSSGYVTDEDLQELQELGVHAMLPKPYTAKQLLDSVEEAKRTSRALAAA